MKRAIRFILLPLFAAYVLGYTAFRSTHAEVWEEDGMTYIIFPKEYPILYYFFRPMMYVDQSLTGMRFHIGFCLTLLNQVATVSPVSAGFPSITL